MAYRVREGLHWCRCSGRILFLDLVEDRYSCLPRTLDSAFLRLSSGATDAADLAALRPLAAAGLLVEDRAPPAPPVTIPPAIGDHCAEPGLSAAADVIAAIASQLRWALVLRLRPLGQIARSLERCAGRFEAPACDPDHVIGRFASAFAAASLLLPVHDRCLVRALAFRSLCVRRGVRPQLVFGVRLNPFHAHCWVQLDRRVLIGDFEQVRLFTPIAVVG